MTLPVQLKVFSFSLEIFCTIQLRVKVWACMLTIVFQITFKGRELIKNFEGSIGVILSKSSYNNMVTIPTARSGSKLCWVFDLRPLSYLEHCDYVTDDAVLVKVPYFHPCSPHVESPVAQWPEHST